MKFGHYHITKEKNYIKFFAKAATWKQVPDPFAFAKNWAQPLLKNEIFEATNLDL